MTKGERATFYASTHERSSQKMRVVSVGVMKWCSKESSDTSYMLAKLLHVARCSASVNAAHCSLLTEKIAPRWLTLWLG